jgi:hypothetical protein
MRLLEHYGIAKPSAKVKAFENGFISERAQSMHEYDWKQIALTMAHFDGEA